MKILLNRISFYTLLFCLLSTYSQAQNYSYDFGNITPEELELNTYLNDSTADAFYIYNMGNASFVKTNEGGLNIYYEYKSKIKILNENAYKYGQIEIPLYRRNRVFEEIENIEAHAYNLENGQIVKSTLEPENIFTEEHNDNWAVVKFAIPNIKVGTIIEYKYNIISSYKFKLRSWYFQKSIPVNYSKFRMEMTPFYQYKFIVQENSKDSLLKSSSFTKAGTSVYGPVEYKVVVNDLEMSNIKAFEDESFLTTTDDYISKVDFQLSAYSDFYGKVTPVITTWDKLSEELLDNDRFGKYIKQARKYAREDLKLVDISNTEADQKLDKIVQFVKDNYRWNNSKGKYATKSASEFHKEKQGNAADINLYLLAMLLEADIEAEPVIISTRDNGKIKYDYPFSHFFNYVLPVVKINNSYILIDATNKLVQNNRIPSFCINDKGLLVSKKESQWIKIMYTHQSVTRNYIKIGFNDQMQLSAQGRLISNEFDAQKFRIDILEKEKEAKEIIAKTNMMQFESVKLENLDQKDKPLIINYDALMDAEFMGDIITVKPFLDFPLRNNPLKFDERNYPIDMLYKKSKTFYSEINLPEGYKMDHVSEDISIDNSLVTILYKTELNDSKIKVIGEYTFKNAIYEPENYLELKEYFNTIVDAFNQKIVLTKN